MNTVNMANEDKKKKKKANGDTTALNMEPPVDSAADSNANAERQPLTGAGAANNHKGADADPPPASDPHKEKLLAAEEGDAAAANGGHAPKKPLAKSGTIDRLQLRRRELEEHLRTRTGLSRQGLLWAMAAVMLLLLLAVITLSLAVAWPRIPHRLQYPACTSTPCLMSSAQMLPRMNPTMDRCTDFWNFSCGGWLDSTPLPASAGRWDDQQQQAAQGRDKARRLISILNHPTNFKSVPWKLKYFYESCMALDNVEADRERPLMKIISELGGWHVRREFSLLSWDYKRVLTLLHSKYGVEPFFSVSVVTDVRRPNQSIIKVGPSGLGLPDRSYYYRSVNSPVVLAYKRYLKDVAQLLGAINTDATSFSEEMFYFERRIAEILSENSTLKTDPIASYHRITLADLKVSAPSIPLHDILLAKFPHGNIDDSMALLVPSKMFLSEISSIISTTDRGALNNYLMWRLASGYMPYLSQHFRDILSLHQKEMAGIKESFDRWEMCTATLQKFMGFALTSLSQRASNNSDNVKTVITEIFEEIRATIQKNIEESWSENELRTHVVDKLTSLSLQVGLPEPFSEDRYLEDLYMHLNVQKNDFFQNILYGITYLQEEQERRLNNPSEEHRWIDAVTGFTVEYIPTANKIVVPPSVLNMPFFDPAYPLPVLFGRIGVHLARAIVSATLPWNNLYAANGSLLGPLDPAVNQSHLMTHQATTCLSKFVMSKKLAERPWTANRTALDTILWVASVQQAYEAFVRVEESIQHTHQPAMENMEPKELFFLNFAQSLCAKRSPEQADLDEVTSPSLSNESVLQVVISQLKAFSEVYQCHGDSSPSYGYQTCPRVI